MKRVIEGKVYNTETATEIATWSNHYFPNDFHYCEETLYRTKKGAWFIAGEGGALSKYSRPCGSNGSCGGDGLEPISAKEAMEWLEQHEFTDELEEHFAENIEEA
jgi:hypothetical protein